MNKRKQILLVDDDEEITELLAAYLVRYGYTAHVAADGAAMQRQLQQHAIDLLVLDLMLPGPDGLSLTRTVRQRSAVPIIMLTARSSPCDRVLGLECGADDYMGKPFEPRELVARIESVLRRRRQVPILQPVSAPVQAHTILCFDGWELHRENRCLYAPTGLVLALSEAEFHMMCTFLQAPQHVFSRCQLMQDGREQGDAGGRSIDLMVSRLRHKLAGVPGGPGIIQTVRGGGYRCNVRTVAERLPRHRVALAPLPTSAAAMQS